MIGNVCPAFSHEYEWNRPHEPKSDHRFALREIVHDRHPGGPGGLGNYIGSYAECKHCGSLYAEEIGEKS